MAAPPFTTALFSERQRIRQAISSDLDYDFDLSRKPSSLERREQADAYLMRMSDRIEGVRKGIASRDRTDDRWALHTKSKGTNEKLRNLENVLSVF